MNRRDFGKSALAVAAVLGVAPTAFAGSPRIIGRYIKRYNKELNFGDTVVLGRSDGQTAEWPCCCSFKGGLYRSCEIVFLRQKNNAPKEYGYEDFARDAKEREAFVREYCPKYSFDIVQMEPM